MYNDPNCTPISSTKWAPPGYKNRHELVEQQDALEKKKPYEKDSRLENAKMSNGKPGINAQQGATRPSSDEATLA